MARPSFRWRKPSTGPERSGEVAEEAVQLEEMEREEVFYEGRGAPAELAVSLLLGATLLYLPLTAQSIGAPRPLRSRELPPCQIRCTVNVRCT